MANLARGTSAKETKNGTGKRGDVCHTVKFITALSNTEQQLIQESESESNQENRNFSRRIEFRRSVTKMLEGPSCMET